MKLKLFVGVLVSIAACGCTLAEAQSQTLPHSSSDPAAATHEAIPDPGPVPLNYVPPALDALSAHAASKSSFTFDRSMLAVAAGLMGNMDDATKHAVASLDGVSVHMLQFTPEIPADPAQVEAIRQAYHLRGWKHVISTTAPLGASSTGGPITDGATDVWIVLDGVNVRGAVILVDSPKNLTLATVAGTLSPEDLLHLRGHFGIPKFEGDDLKGDNREKENGRQIQ